MAETEGQLQREPRGRQDPKRLAHHVADHDAQRDRGGEGVGQQAAIDVDARVGEREEWHHDEARPGVQAILHPLVGRDRQCDPALGRASELGRRLLAERARELHDLLELGPCGRVGARHEANRKAADHRIDPRLVQRDPQADAEHRRSRGAPRVGREAQGCHGHEQSAGDQQRQDGDGVGVDDRDHGQRHKVVEDREREQPYPQAGPPGCHEREDAQSERRVGRHRGAPAVGRVAAPIEREIDPHRDGHAAERGHNRDRHAPPVAQLSHVELPPGLESYHEEEERHEPFVDPMTQVHGDARILQPDRELCGPHRLVGMWPRRVGPDERGDGGQQQRHGSTRFGAQEVTQRCAEVASPCGALAEAPALCSGVGVLLASHPAVHAAGTKAPRGGVRCWMANCAASLSGARYRCVGGGYL
jgi:hypothetical protein